jgi:hypothetical protein
MGMGVTPAAMSGGDRQVSLRSADRRRARAEINMTPIRMMSRSVMGMMD